MRKYSFRVKWLLLVCGCLAIAGWCAVGAAPPDQPPHNRWVEGFNTAGIGADTVWVTMRDGTRLATTIGKPFWGSNFPTVLIRTPYEVEQGYLDIITTLLPLSGYAVAVQYTRGRFDSEGEDRVFQDDGWGENQDGYDTVEWIAAQSWSDGKIGTWGLSALAIAQSLMAGAAPPHLTCQYISYGVSKAYDQVTYQGGAFRKALVTGWLTGQGSLHMLPEFQAHPTEDTFWDQYDIESRHPLITAPALFVGGFYDCFLQGTINEFVGRQTNGGEGAIGNNRLILGPWTHVNETDTRQGQLRYPDNSTISISDQVELVLDWFDYWLKGEDNGVLSGEPVRYYLMSDVDTETDYGNEWRISPVWPPVAHEGELYLHPEGALDATIPQANDEPVQITFNPTNPIPTHGGANLEIDEGPYDQTPIETRGDVITFTTEPLTQPLEVAGRVSAVIYASCNISDMDLSVRLSDVYPDGRSMLLCDGILRAGFRDGFQAKVPMRPGEVYQCEIDLWSTAIAFNTGHRIRLSIANSNYPRFDLNPAYSLIGQQGYPDSLETLIYCDAAHPSTLVLPVIAPAPGEHPLLPIDTGVLDWDVR
ncbi:MAG: CocE/NonD family hydrolase [bacterium]